MSDEQRESFHRSLPTKRMAAGCVVSNAAAEILVVKPTYSEYWELPGGAVEDDESLWDACRREVREELGIELVSGSLLCVDYCSSQPGYVESLMFLFDGGVLDQQIIGQIRLDREELSDLTWVPAQQAIEMLGGRVARRLDAVLPLVGTGSCVYLEDQSSVDTSSSDHQSLGR